MFSLLCSYVKQKNYIKWFLLLQAPFKCWRNCLLFHAPFIFSNGYRFCCVSVATRWNVKKPSLNFFIWYFITESSFPLMELSGVYTKVSDPPITKATMINYSTFLSTGWKGVLDPRLSEISLYCHVIFTNYKQKIFLCIWSANHCWLSTYWQWFDVCGCTHDSIFSYSFLLCILDGPIAFSVFLACSQT